MDYKQKIIEPADIESLSYQLRKENKKIVTLNGSFDLLHAGHLYILYAAKLQGDVLVVALNSDVSIKTYKKSDRPIVPLEYRLQMMAAISAVDYVTWFEETDPRTILKKIVPAIHVNGAEYGENCIEAETVKALGGKIHLVERIPSLSTSSLIKKIQALCD